MSEGFTDINGKPLPIPDYSQRYAITEEKRIDLQLKRLLGLIDVGYGLIKPEEKKALFGYLRENSELFLGRLSKEMHNHFDCELVEDTKDMELKEPSRPRKNRNTTRGI
jgi:hypothetical protein